VPILLKPESSRSFRNNQELPIVPLRDTVVFPQNETTLTFGRSQSIEAILKAFSSNKKVFLVCQKDPQQNHPGKKDIYLIGTICRLENILRVDGAVYAIIRGLSRARIKRITATKPFFKGELEVLTKDESEDDNVAVFANLLMEQLKKAFSLGKVVEPQFINKLDPASPVRFVNQISAVLDIDASEKQELLETDNLRVKLEKVTKYLAQEIKVLELDRKISSQTQDHFDKSMREAVLRQRRETIDKELGKIGVKEIDPEIKRLKDKIKTGRMPIKVKKRANSELNRLVKMSPMNPESGYLRAYLDWLTSVPWEKRTPNNISLKEAAEILDKDHYGLKKVKERILEHLAVMQLRGKSKKVAKKGKQAVSPTILCFIGPPGVGKTSVGKSIARALGRKFVRISLGGVRDEAEIRGHRRTYVGALPGRIIQGMKEADTKNPVFMLDEIDKVGKDFRGDPSAALLEALDPEQNKEFSDHYLEVPYDLSEVFFITTGNILDTIPPALRDRLEIIRFPGYTDEEKYHIAKSFLWPKQITAHALDGRQLSLTLNAYYEIIRRYTREAGVRQLERELAKIDRKLARQIAEGKRVKKKIGVAEVHSLLGTVQFSSLSAEKKDEVGRATGLAWTQAGGEILFIEVALMPGKGRTLLTGHLGNVMKESCRAAISYVRSHWKKFGLKKDFAKDMDIHIHVPEGAVPKDGPSAGVAITTAVVSALTKQPAKSNIGMTGEITLRGKVLEIGGVKEKVLAAHRAGLKTIILPKPNKKDLEDIPKKIRGSLKFIFVDELSQALKVVLRKK